MKRREFVKSSICLGCAGACGLQIPFAKAEEMTFTPEEKLAMQKFIYKSVDELPKKVKLDICSICQLKCPECGIRKNEKYIEYECGGFGYVSFKKFKSFIDKNPFIEEIELSNHGEIFLNPDIDKILEYAYKKNIVLTAFTGVNLNYLPEKTAENLVKYKLRYMHVSIDGATPETYAIYRIGGDFDKVINNIKMINKFKEKYNSQYPIMTYKFIIFGHNEHETDLAVKLAKKLNMNILFDTNCSPEYSPVKDIEKLKYLTSAKILYQNGKHICMNIKTEEIMNIFVRICFLDLRLILMEIS